MPPRPIATATSPPNTWFRCGFSDVSNRPPVDSRPGWSERSSGADFSVCAGVDRHLQIADARPRAAIGGRGMRGGGGLLWPEYVRLCIGAGIARDLGAIGRAGDRGDRKSAVCRLAAAIESRGLHGG